MESMTSYPFSLGYLVKRMCTILFVFLFANKQRKFIHLISTRLFGNQSYFLWWWWNNGLPVLTRLLISWFHAESSIFYFVYFPYTVLVPRFLNSCQLSTSSRWVFVWLSRIYLLLRCKWDRKAIRISNFMCMYIFGKSETFMTSFVCTCKGANVGVLNFPVERD